MPRNLTPGDNVLYCAARLYQERGAVSMTIRALRDRAEQLGLPLPTTPSSTLRFARHGGKPMFRATEGRWQLTAQGEQYLRSMYGVTPARTPAVRRAA